MTYKPKLKLWDTQAKGLKKMRGKEAFALLMAMRTGKSPVALADFGEMEEAGVVKDQLIIAPAGAYLTWLEAIKKHASDDLQERMLVHIFHSGAGVGERHRLKQFMTTKDQRRPRTLLMNVEAFSRPGEARKLAVEFLDQRPKKTSSVVDEVTAIKNSSKRTRFINRFIANRSIFRRILSGLATPRSPLDLFYEFEFLDWRILGFWSWYAFRAHIAFLKLQWLGGRSVQIIDKEQGDNGFRPEAIKELYKLIEPHSYRVQFRPKVPSTYSIREVEMTDEQKKHYYEIKEFATTKLASMTHVTATVVIAQLMRMHQILCGHVGDEEGNEIAIPENKTAAVMEILDDYDGKAVIWCSYDYNVRNLTKVIQKAYGENSVARFWGGNIKTRNAEAQSFINDKSRRFMIATPDAGRYANTWSMADLAIYFSSRDNLDHRDQSEQRTMGVEKEHGVDNVDVIHTGTIEMKILESLRKKINMASVINGDNYREWLI